MGTQNKKNLDTIENVLALKMLSFLSKVLNNVLALKQLNTKTQIPRKADSHTVIEIILFIFCFIIKYILYILNNKLYYIYFYYCYVCYIIFPKKGLKNDKHCVVCSILVYNFIEITFFILKIPHIISNHLYSYITSIRFT